MRKILQSLFLTIVLFAHGALADNDIRFEAVDVFVTSTEPFAAWQFELSDGQGQMQVVGVEQGESSAFDRAPYYDRDAVNAGLADRIIVADFSLAETASLPSGRVRVATIHLMLRGDTDLALQLITATDSNGRVIDASIELEQETGSKQ